MDFSQDYPLVHTAWEICRWHHERWDGKGYPDGLKGEEILSDLNNSTTFDITINQNKLIDKENLEFMRD